MSYRAKWFNLLVFVLVKSSLGSNLAQIESAATGKNFSPPSTRWITEPDQGLCRRKYWAALVVLTKTLKTAPFTVTIFVNGCQKLVASRLRALSTMKPVELV